MSGSVSFVAFPPIEKLGVISDRRTAVIIAADGTVCWCCLPNYDAEPIFGALLDVEKGGFYRLGPKIRLFGEQQYECDTAILRTQWQGHGYLLELSDAMLWPESTRPIEREKRRVMVRRLRAVTGTCNCTLSMELRPDFGAPVVAEAVGGRFIFDTPRGRISFWTSVPLIVTADGVGAEFKLSEGQDVWAILDFGNIHEAWDREQAEKAIGVTSRYWLSWMAGLDPPRTRNQLVRRSALLVQMLTFAPTGAPLAAPPTSLPERIGGSPNYDYRYSWIRDASLSINLLSMLGQTAEAGRYFDWLEHLPLGEKMALQVVYRIDGGKKMPLIERNELTGYRESRPIRIGNPAADMVELDSFGYLADAALIFLDHGGQWRNEFWDLIRHIADFTAERWLKPNSGIWELLPAKHFVSSKIMSWVTLDRAIRIGEKLARADVPGNWRAAVDAIWAEVMERGWSEHMGSFRQHSDSETIDAALLLIPLMGFLPADDPRVSGTLAQIEARLMINGFVYRFVTSKSDQSRKSAARRRGGCIFDVHLLACSRLCITGRKEKAAAILRPSGSLVAKTGLFFEAVDTRIPAMMGNFPLMFSQVEYAKAVIACAANRRDYILCLTLRRISH